MVTQPGPYTVAGCPFFVGPSPSPCVTAQWVTAATRVLAGGAPILLQDSQAAIMLHKKIGFFIDGRKIAFLDLEAERLGHQEFILTYKSFEPLGPACFPSAA